MKIEKLGMATKGTRRRIKAAASKYRTYDLTTNNCKVTIVILIGVVIATAVTALTMMLS